jgi:LEA14-like dessication related protein
MKAVIIMYHPSPSAEKQWFREFLPKHEKTIKARINMKIDFVYLEKIDYNAGLQDSADVV